MFKKDPDAKTEEQYQPPLEEKFDELVDGKELRDGQLFVIGLALASSLGVVIYHLTMHDHFIQRGYSALLFIGIPAVIAILLALTPRAKSVTGAVLKGITFFLLIVAPLMGEGWICIVIASPLFYVIGLVIGLFVDVGRKRRNRTLSCVAILVLPMCMEGMFPQWTVERTQTVMAVRTINAPVDDVARALAAPPRIELPLKGFLGIGFPRPLETHGHGVAAGDLRTIHLSGAEGDPAGDVTVRVARSGPGELHLEVTRDTTKLAQWLDWRYVDVQWRAIDAAHTEVSWSITFDRKLDPAWYFNPWERWAVRDVAEYMIRASATPAETR